MRELTHTDRHWLTTDRQTIILIDWTDKFDFDFEVRGLRWGGGCYEVQVVKLSLQYEGRTASGHLQVTATGNSLRCHQVVLFLCVVVFHDSLGHKTARTALDLSGPNDKTDLLCLEFSEYQIPRN